MKNISFINVNFDSGFWKKRCDINAEVSLQSVYERFEQTGRFDALRFQKNAKTDIFYDSDVAKWIETVAYLIEKRGGYEKEQKIIDDLVDSMERFRLPSGYINSYFIVCDRENIFTRRQDHELYCAGHLIEAAIAYRHATGKEKFFHLMLDYVDCIDRCFIKEKTSKFCTCGHEEIELALLKLYRVTGFKKYLDMAMFFLNQRGTKQEDHYAFALDNYDQSDMPVRQMKKAQGHAVRAAYLYTAMSDAAFLTEDTMLLKACEHLFHDIVDKKMYITGGIGSNRVGESFTISYDLPGLEAYSESCAAIGLLLFSLSMQQHGFDAKYADVIEKVMYNNLLSSTSMDGKAFFYENPLEIHLSSIGKQTSIAPQYRDQLPIVHRKEVFDCSCCPPNINRIFARLGDFFFSETEDVLIVNQYACVTLNNNKITLKMQAEFSRSGQVLITATENQYQTIYVRKPSWCGNIEVKGLSFCEEGDYLRFDHLKSKFSLEIDFDMRAYFAESNPHVRNNNGRVALCYGPTVYCIERIDNPYELNALSVDMKSEPTVKEFPDFPYFYNFEVEGYLDEDFTKLYRPYQGQKRSVKLLFRPYWTFANREESDMLVWVRR